MAPDVDGIIYIINNNKATVTYPRFYNSSTYSGNVIIPETVIYNGTIITVTSIGDNAFSDCSGLTSVTIPNSVTSIGDKAFSDCSGLTSVTISNSVTSIGDKAFSDCSGLTSVTIPNPVTSIGDKAFLGCSSLATLNFNAISCSDFSSTESYRPFSNLNISTINIGDSVQKIPAYFAAGLNQLTSINIPNSVTTIGNFAFSGCNGLTRVDISDIASWCNISFGNNTSNPLYFTHHLYLNDSEVTDLVIPNNVNKISDNAFYYCSGLKNVSIPNSVTTIGKAAFAWCNGLTSVNIPNAVTTIGNSAFYNCSKLTSIDIPSSVTSIGDYAFQGCSALKTLYFNAIDCDDFSNSSTTRPFYHLNISNIHIGNTVQRVPAYFAYGLSNVTEVTIGNSITGVGTKAFNDCTGLTRVSISDLAVWCTINFESATSNPLYYAKHLYVNDNEMTDLFVPDGVESIGDYAFYNCHLTSIRLHQSVTSVGKQAFNNCPTIATITCEAMTPPLWNDFAMFPSNVYNHSPLYVPRSSLTAYKADQCWGQFATIIGMDDDILATSITLNQSQMSLMVGNTSQLAASVLPDSTTNKKVNWMSSMPAVATVDENGLVTALAVGSATITATTTDGSNQSASCLVTVSEDISDYDNFLSLRDTTAFHGDMIVIPVAMTNAASITAFQTDIFLPEGITLMQEDGDYLIDPSERMTRTHSIMSNEVSSGAIRVICYSSNYKAFTGNSGDELFFITVKVADNAEGDYIIQLKNTLLTNTDFVDIAAPDVAATINVKAYIPGDANASGTVTVTDVVVTAQYVLELNPKPFNYEAADVNEDNNITVADVARIAWMVLNPSLNAPRRTPTEWNSNDRMSGKTVTLKPGETRTVSIMLDNEMLYSAFQLDLRLPEGMIASNFALTDRAGDHAFDVNTLTNGKLRALCYSPVLDLIEGNEGTLLTFDVTATNITAGNIIVDGIELVTNDCQTIHLDGFAIGVNTVTNVNDIVDGKTIARLDYYNLAGQRIDRPESGVTLVVTTYTDGTRTTTKIFK